MFRKNVANTRYLGLALLLFLLWTIHSHGDALDYWFPRSPGTPNEQYGVAYGNNTFVTVGAGGTILTSPDGVTWTERKSGTDKTIWSVVFGNGRFIARGGDQSILSSPDGVTWAGYTPEEDIRLSGISCAKDVFFGFGEEGWFFTSPDGVAWTARDSGTGQQLHCVAYGNGVFVILGDAGTILTSRDSVTWTAAKAEKSSFVWPSSVAFGGGLFVLLADSRIILTSTNGVSWTKRLASEIDSFYTITYGGGVFVATSTPATILTSRDGLSWTTHVSPRGEQLRDAAYGKDTFVLVADRETILQSDPLTKSAAGGTVTDEFIRKVRAGLRWSEEEFDKFAAASSVEQLRTLMNDPNWGVFKAATQVLVMRNELRKEDLLRVFKKTDFTGEKFGETLDLLTMVGNLEDASFLPRLEELLADPKVTSNTKSFVLSAIAQIPGDESWALLTKAVGSPDAEVRGAAVSHLAGRPGKPVADVLIPMVADKDPRVRTAVAYVFGELENPGTLDAIVKLCGDEDARVRQTAAWALGNLRDKRATETLDKVVKTSGSYSLIGEEARDALRKIAGGSRVPAKDEQAQEEKVQALYRDLFAVIAKEQSAVFSRASAQKLEVQKDGIASEIGRICSKYPNVLIYHLRKDCESTRDSEALCWMFALCYAPVLGKMPGNSIDWLGLLADETQGCMFRSMILTLLLDEHESNMPGWPHLVLDKQKVVAVLSGLAANVDEASEIRRGALSKLAEREFSNGTSQPGSKVGEIGIAMIKQYRKDNQDICLGVIDTMMRARVDKTAVRSIINDLLQDAAFANQRELLKADLTRLKGTK